MLSQAGETILLPKAQDQPEHLWVLLTKPSGAPAKVVIANLTTQRSYSDTTMVLNVADHPFVHHPTVVNYADCRIVELDSLRR